MAGAVVGAAPGAVVRWAERVGNAWSPRGGSLMALRLGKNSAFGVCKEGQLHGARLPPQGGMAVGEAT